MKNIIVFGGAGFIGSHLVKKLKEEVDNYVIVIDRHESRFLKIEPDLQILCNLQDIDSIYDKLPEYIDEVYQLSADLGGSLFIDNKANDYLILTNNTLININVLQLCVKKHVKKIFFSSSGCVYPDKYTDNELSYKCYSPINAYGWEKLNSEKLYQAYSYKYGFQLRIGRFYNIYGPNQYFDGGKERVVAALCRKVIQTYDGIVQILGSGEQKRTFLYIDDCIDSIIELMESDYSHPLNIGSNKLISIKDLLNIIIKISGKKIVIKTDGVTLGGDNRECNIKLIKEVIGWEPKIDIEEGIKHTYSWIFEKIHKSKNNQI